MELVPASLVVAYCRANGMGPIALYSVYGHTGGALDEENSHLLQVLLLHAQGHGLPFIAGGHWNMEPHTLRPILPRAVRL
eukprot:5558202-Amphidinium_carterae.1